MRRLYISVIAFVFVASFTLAINIDHYYQQESTNESNTTPQVQAYETTIPQPILTGEEPLPNISSYAIYAIDLDSGTILCERNSNYRLLPASTTKIITALVAMEYYSLDDVLEVPIFSIEGQKMNLVSGEQLSVRDLIYGILVYSANDAAEVLARNYPGGRDSFITAMNLKAWEVGLRDSYFENPTGFDGTMQYITASDLVKIAAYAMQNDFFREVVGTKEIVVGSQDGNNVHHLTNINELLGEVDGVMGIKTGWTENARENLVTYIERDGRKIIIAVLNSQDRFGDTKAIIDWIFSNYSWSN